MYVDLLFFTKMKVRILSFIKIVYISLILGFNNTRNENIIDL